MVVFARIQAKIAAEEGHAFAILKVTVSGQRVRGVGMGYGIELVAQCGTVVPPRVAVGAGIRGWSAVCCEARQVRRRIGWPPFG